MEKEQANRFAFQILEQNNDGAFDIQLEEATEVAEAFRRLGCRVRHDLFRPGTLHITPPVTTEVSRAGKLDEKEGAAPLGGPSVLP